MAKPDRKLRTVFYTAASPECDFNVRSDVYKPAAAFEVHNHVTGIAGYYRFPRGMSPADYERRLPSRAEDEVRRDWGVLKRLNPELHRIKVDTRDAHLLHDAVKGVSCLFNTDDIDFFIGMQANGSKTVFGDAMQNRKYAALYYKVRQQAAYQVINWVPAPPTLRNMLRQLDGGPA